jgi:REP element-mobilizing transposase RayT
MAGAEYFLTICTEARHAGLTEALRVRAILAEAQAMTADTTWRLRCAVVMPDHVHMLMTLGDRLSLGSAVARLKGKTAAGLACSSSGQPPLRWERGYFDHRIRPNDDRVGLFLYVFLNPFRSGLSKRGDRWPWYCCCEDDWTWFKEWLTEERPRPEWLE